MDFENNPPPSPLKIPPPHIRFVWIGENQRILGLVLIRMKRQFTIFPQGILLLPPPGRGIIENLYRWCQFLAYPNLNFKTEKDYYLHREYPSWNVGSSEITWQVPLIICLPREKCWPVVCKLVQGPGTSRYRRRGRGRRKLRWTRRPWHEAPQLNQSVLNIN